MNFYEQWARQPASRSRPWIHQVVICCITTTDAAASGQHQIINFSTLERRVLFWLLLRRWGKPRKMRLLLTKLWEIHTATLHSVEYVLKLCLEMVFSLRTALFTMQLNKHSPSMSNFQNAIMSKHLKYCECLFRTCKLANKKLSHVSLTKKLIKPIY